MQVKKSISVDDAFFDECKEVAEKLGLNFNRFVKAALSEYLYKARKEKQGNLFLEVENPSFTPKLDKQADEHIIKVLGSASEELKGIDPMGIGEASEKLYQYAMQRLMLDDKEQIQKYFKEKYDKGGVK